MTIKVYELFKQQKITSLTAGERIFNLLKKNLEENPNDLELVLDFENVYVFTNVPFQKLISKMKVSFNANIQVKLINQTELINKSFRSAL